MVKNTVNKMVKNISIIAIFVSIAITALLYLGPNITLNTSLVFRLAVPSVILALSLIVIYDLWITNGKQVGYDEPDYQALVKDYHGKSDNLNYSVMQEFLDFERKRRHDVEFEVIQSKIDREVSILNKIDVKDEKRIKKVNKYISKLKQAQRDIVVSMPFTRSEEFDYLRHAQNDIVYKEYSPNDTKMHLIAARTRKYISTIFLTVVGFNAISIGGERGDIWPAIIMTLLAMISLMFAVVSGFTTGYNNISVVSTGIYNTANSLLDQANGYCREHNKELYHQPKLEKVSTENSDNDETVDIYEKIFTNAEAEVDKN